MSANGNSQDELIPMVRADSLMPGDTVWARQDWYVVKVLHLSVSTAFTCAKVDGVVGGGTNQWHVNNDYRVPCTRALTVRVLAFNDAGEPRMEYGSGHTTDHAVAAAIATLVEDTQDTTWAMSEWWAS